MNWIKQLFNKKKTAKQCDIHVVSGSALKPISMELSKEIRTYIDMQTYMKTEMRRCLGIPVKKKKRAWWKFWHYH